MLFGRPLRAARQYAFSEQGKEFASARSKDSLCGWSSSGACWPELERSRPERRCVLLLIPGLIVEAQGCRTPREQEFWGSSCAPVPSAAKLAPLSQVVHKGIAVGNSMSCRKEPRLVLDSAICGVNPKCNIPERISDGRASHIACFEIALMRVAWATEGQSVRGVRMPSGTDTTASEAGVNKLFTAAWPAQTPAQPAAVWACEHKWSVMASHIPGERNVWADQLAAGTHPPLTAPHDFWPHKSALCLHPADAPWRPEHKSASQTHFRRGHGLARLLGTLKGGHLSRLRMRVQAQGKDTRCFSSCTPEPGLPSDTS